MKHWVDSRLGWLHFDFCLQRKVWVCVYTSSVCLVTKIPSWFIKESLKLCSWGYIDKKAVLGKIMRLTKCDICPPVPSPLYWHHFFIYPGLLTMAHVYTGPPWQEQSLNISYPTCLYTSIKTFLSYISFPLINSLSLLVTTVQLTNLFMLI